ncbi:MAG: hypothetical protein M1517_01355 [Deltaproteobacteria bacterium]|nr:hypothetical protein [Deltaproteobacteria bacterium]
MKRKGYTVVGIGGLVIASVVAGLILAARLNITTATNATEAKIWSEKPDTVAAQGPGGSQSCFAVY